MRWSFWRERLRKKNNQGVNMELGSTYKTGVYYFALGSMLRNCETEKRHSKRAEKQFDFIKSFIDSKDAEQVRKSVKGGKDGKSI